MRYEHLSTAQACACALLISMALATRALASLSSSQPYYCSNNIGHVYTSGASGPSEPLTAVDRFECRERLPCGSVLCFVLSFELEHAAAARLSRIGLTLLDC
jgi:hypothetical protein